MDDEGELAIVLVSGSSNNYDDLKRNNFSNVRKNFSTEKFRCIFDSRSRCVHMSRYRYDSTDKIICYLSAILEIFVAFIQHSKQKMVLILSNATFKTDEKKTTKNIIGRYV